MQTKQLTLEQWLVKVDAIIGACLGGLSKDDLPDINYSELWESNVSPKTAARIAIRNAGGGEELLP